MIIKIAQIIIISLYLAKCYIYLANLFQQNHYDKIKYIKSLKKYYLYKIYQYYYYVGGLFLILNFFVNNLFYLTLILLLASFCHRNTYVIKLKFTKRIIRLTITTSLLLVLLAFLVIKINALFYLSVVLLPFIIVIANFINIPIEKIINHYYINKAKRKAKKIVIKQKIAITGSFGKTTTKDILHSVISKNYLVDKTPKSYNTILGISKTINENLKYPLDAYIMEMGAFKQKEIKKMSKIFNPNIVMITEIGMQHMSTFKKIENIVKAKFEILEGLSSNGSIILNYENRYIRNYDITKYQNKILYPNIDIYTYGIEFGRYQAKNIKFDKNITIFDIYENDKFLLQIKTHLLGRHQILNILSVYCAICALRKENIIISDDDFKNVLEDIANTEHRLSYKRQDNLSIYDDSYSSNIVGFVNACEVISHQDGKKIIITPGIVDGGNYDEVLNQNAANSLLNIFDEIYLIDNPSSRIIANYLDNQKVKYHVFSTFKLAYLDVLSKYNIKETKVNLLIENDLPDSFLER